MNIFSCVMCSNSTAPAWLGMEAWTGTEKQEHGINHGQEKPGRYMVKME